MFFLVCCVVVRMLAVFFFQPSFFSSRCMHHPLHEPCLLPVAYPRLFNLWNNTSCAMLTYRRVLWSVFDEMPFDVSGGNRGRSCWVATNLTTAKTYLCRIPLPASRSGEAFQANHAHESQTWSSAASPPSSIPLHGHMRMAEEDNLKNVIGTVYYWTRTCDSVKLLNNWLWD